MAPAVPLITARIQFDSSGVPTWIGPRPLRMASNQDLSIEVTVEQVDETVTPPAVTPIDVSTWSSFWAAKLDINDDDGDALWAVDGDMSAGANGKILFTVAAADADVVADLIPSEFVLIPLIAGTAGSRVRLLVTLFKGVLAIP